MVLFPNAKINIGLNIVSKREDAYHNIESIFYPIPFSDILEIQKSSKFQYSSSGLFIEGEIENNLVVKVFRLFEKEHQISPVHIHLHKVIPTGTGLGGGSADASFAINMFNEIFQLNLSNTEKEKYALQIGSDCPFFIENLPKKISGRGEIMENSSLSLQGYFIKLILPNIHISTKEAYQGINPKVPDFSVLKNDLPPIENWSGLIKNDFENTVFGLYPELEKIKKELYQTGALYASMSGTGSAMYGIFKELPIEVESNHKNYLFKL